MYPKSIICLVFLLLGACSKEDNYPTYQETSSRAPMSVPSDFPSDDELKASEVTNKREQEIGDRIRKDKNLNWMSIGISTGKYTESITSDVYKTWEECENANFGEANTCAPIRALPESYWKIRG